MGESNLNANEIKCYSVDDLYELIFIPYLLSPLDYLDLLFLLSDPNEKKESTCISRLKLPLNYKPRN